MAYAELSVIVDGALETEEIFHDETLMNARVEEIKEDARGDGYPTEVFILYHEHDDTDDGCECIQYVTDHKPAHSWNMNGPGTGFDN